jgi:hypothetical protein
MASNSNISANSNLHIFDYALGHESGGWQMCFDGKTADKKSCDNVRLSNEGKIYFTDLSEHAL